MFANTETQDHRKEVCENCEKKMGILCGECGCLLSVKVKIEAARCPLNKWNK